MTKEKITKLVKQYTLWKRGTFWAVIIFALLTAILGMVGLFVTNIVLAGFCIASYIAMLAFMIIACAFPHDKALTDFITLNDYKVILEYFCCLPENLPEQEYKSLLFLTKRALDCTVHFNHLEGTAEKLPEHLYYLQGTVFRELKPKEIPANLLNKNYIEMLCKELLKQINEGRFLEKEVSNIECDDKNIVKQSFFQRMDSSVVTIAILSALAGFKVVISWNSWLYELAGENIILRVIYNVGADVIAVYLAIKEWRNKKM